MEVWQAFNFTDFGICIHIMYQSKMLSYYGFEYANLRYFRKYILFTITHEARH